MIFPVLAGFPVFLGPKVGPCDSSRSDEKIFGIFGGGGGLVKFQNVLFILKLHYDPIQYLNISI